MQDLGVAGRYPTGMGHWGRDRTPSMTSVFCESMIAHWPALRASTCTRMPLRGGQWPAFRGNVAFQHPPTPSDRNVLTGKSNMHIRDG